MRIARRARAPRSSRSQPAGRSASAASRPLLVAALALVCAGAAAYSNALHGLRVLDDHRTLVENTSIRQLSPLSAVLHPPRQMPVTGRPLVNLSFALNYAFGELKVESYHVLNIIVHVLTALPLLGFLRISFTHMADRLAWRPGRTLATSLAFACALMWVVHPLNSEVVNYLTQRTESMMGLFFLASLYAAARAAHRGDDRGIASRRAPKLWRWELAAVLSAFASVACKETALTLPLVLVLWDRGLVFPSFAAAWASRRRLYGAVTASWLLFGWFARELPFFAPAGFEQSVSRWDYLLHQGPIILRYLRLAVWPIGLVFDYGAPGPLVLSEVWLPTAAVAVLAVGAALAFWRYPTLGFWGAWFFITLAPASSLIPIPTEVGAERRMYLPLISVVVLLVLLWYAALRRLGEATIRDRLSWALLVMLTIALGATTFARNRDYADGVRLWQTVLDRRPHTRAHEHLSIFLRDAGRIDESMAHLRIAAPQSANALHALASARLERGDRTGALADFREFVTRYPDNRHILEAREAFGRALLDAGDAAAAVEQFRVVVTKSPNYARGQVGLAGALSRAGDVDGARAAYREALRIQPQNVLALVNLGLIEASVGETEQAIQTLKHALLVQPAELTARRRLVSLLLERRQPAELEAEARALIQYAPSDSDGHNVLGVALAWQQQYGPAKAAFTEAVRLDPANTSARENLARLR